jgi:hypothetical protein
VSLYLPGSQNPPAFSPTQSRLRSWRCTWSAQAPFLNNRLAHCQCAVPSDAVETSRLTGYYIDCGFENIGILSDLGTLDVSCVTITTLRGNHGMYLDTFLRDQDCDFNFIESWMSNRGNHTLFELGFHYEEFFQTLSACSRSTRCATSQQRRCAALMICSYRHDLRMGASPASMRSSGARRLPEPYWPFN